MFVRPCIRVDLLTHTPEYSSTILYRDIFKYEMRNSYLYRARVYEVVEKLRVRACVYTE